MEIVFQGNADDSVLKTSTASSISYKNNGRPFQPEDWSRLRKIAEGNPDEQSKKNTESLAYLTTSHSLSVY